MKLSNNILKDYEYFWQKNNLNPDGSSNMDYNTLWGRFNQCFISSSTASYNQCLERLRSKGLQPIDGFKTSKMDELTYLISFLSKHNKDGKLTDNKDRYNWDDQCKHLNYLLQCAFKDKIPGKFKWGSSSISKIINVIKSNYQPIVGIWIGDFYSGAGGHITTVCGWQETEENKITGLFFCDPAGNLIQKGSYKTSLGEFDGKEIFYPESIFPKIFPTDKGRHMMWFEENEK